MAMARVYERYGSKITAQASMAIAGNAFSGGALVQMKKASGQNSDGAQWFDVFIDVTVAPSSDAEAEIWISGSPDGTMEAEYEFALSAKVDNVVGKVHMGVLHSTPYAFKAKIKAIDYSYTATLYVVPVHFADA